jgi:hypothetical protein
MKTTLALLMIALLAPRFAPAQQSTEEAKRKQADFMRRTMEQFTPEERSHMAANRNVNRTEWIAEHPARESTGLIALPDLGKGLYQGQQGGLYPGGENAPPPAHLKAGLKLARKVVPLDADGRESKDGKIVLISIGMSNTTMKFQTFQKLAAGDASLNLRLVLLDGAQGGQVAWVTSKSTTPFWDVVDERLKATGVTGLRASKCRRPGCCRRIRGPTVLFRRRSRSCNRTSSTLCT